MFYALFLANHYYSLMSAVAQSLVILALLLIVSDFDVYSSSVIIPLRGKSKSLLVLASVS